MRILFNRPAATFQSLALVASVIACADATAPTTAPTTSTLTPGAPVDDRRARHLQCDPDNAGITLPPGFCALVVADLVMDGAPAQARHMSVTPRGDLFVAINSPGNRNPSFGIVGLRDNDGDGKADEQTQFSAGLGGSGLAWRDGRLFFGANDRVLRFRLPDGRLTPTDNPEVVVTGLPNTGDHISKTVVLDRGNRLFVNIGSSSNSCQVANRQAQSPGVFPCPDLPIRAGVWEFDSRGSNQTEARGRRFATGYRNMVALAVNPRDGELFGVQHGRDMLFENWPQFFTPEEDAVLPAEEFVRISRNSNNGWPYCYFDDVFQHRKVLGPEYGGDGEKVTGPNGINCAKFNQPLAQFGAHWAPNGLTFYSGNQFPRRYRDGAFIAFHGGFDRAPLPNEGFKVMFVPMGGKGSPSGPSEVFADGFAGSPGPLPATAMHRPVGVTEGPDGSLFVSDDRGGRIYRIVFVGDGHGGPGKD
ncbi:MAG TPA: PQQ-dependent sugar dehydrogenase [Gemmatimonadaceae bacterium]|nr:PQQ-dependent sugar dehydrogenase [Gemmatimonadaceae bacterium]